MSCAEQTNIKKPLDPNDCTQHKKCQFKPDYFFIGSEDEKRMKILFLQTTASPHDEKMSDKKEGCCSSILPKERYVQNCNINCEHLPFRYSWAVLTEINDLNTETELTVL